MDNIDPVFNTSKKDLRNIWVELQNFQADFAFHQELALFYQSSSWHIANNVLDAGCGNGYYLKLLGEYFSNKKYVGVDISAELLDIARQDSHPDFYDFLDGDFFNVEGVYDAIIMRLFLQHLQNPERAIDKAKTLLRRRGCIFIVDSVDKCRYYYPDLPKFRKLFELYCAQQQHQKRNRNIASQIAEYAASTNEWDIQVNQDIIIPSTLCSNHKIFKKVYPLFVDMIENVGEIDYPFQDTRDELISWSDKGGYTQIGLKLLSLVKI